MARPTFTLQWEPVRVPAIPSSLAILRFGETGLTRALQWGYGHVSVFAAASLVGGRMLVTCDNRCDVRGTNRVNAPPRVYATALITRFLPDVAFRRRSAVLLTDPDSGASSSRSGYCHRVSTRSSRIPVVTRER